MIIKATLGNPNHLEYGVATIPFPIPREEYDHCINFLESLKTNRSEKNHLANQRSVCEVERTSSGMIEFSRLRGNERYGACEDEVKPHSFRRWHTNWNCAK